MSFQNTQEGHLIKQHRNPISLQYALRYYVKSIETLAPNEKLTLLQIC